MSRRVYRKVAKKYGVSVSEVKQEIQASITAAYTNPPNDGITKAYSKGYHAKAKYLPPMSLFAMRQGR